ncbi:hypothetical protein GOBAR_AA26560 [Gossypium barbadense]|uniref:DUF7725 domain-containing protein n=1 Tax=Gossypium barbadense TaxID=3634 RepID=A0A2P5WSN8_GOSBA|nr:hypothetical protein GOBAR_AA26560 [Gossypium barbadense]
MDSAASVTAGRSGSLPMTSPSRKEWRAVSELHVVQNLGDEVEFEISKVEQSDERTVYEQQIHNVSRQREELQRMEVELRAQAIARPRILDLQSSCDAKIEAHAAATVKLEEQIHESEKTTNELKRRMEEKDRELHAIKVEKEEAWAKEDLLREQNKELATFRRERDHSEAERARHLKQIHDLQEHVEEKERQLMELQEQYRASQETILYKDERLREVQTWISSVQEMDALQSSTNHSLQAELRERTEQYDQLWHGCQRQIDLVSGCFSLRRWRDFIYKQYISFNLNWLMQERNSSYTDESHASQAKSKDLSQFGKNNGNKWILMEVFQQIMLGSFRMVHLTVLNRLLQMVIRQPRYIEVTISPPLPSSFHTPSNIWFEIELNHNDHNPSIPITPSSLLGMPTYLPPGQGFPHSVASQVGQYSMPTISSTQQWQNQQISPEGFQLSAQNQVPPSQTDQSFVRSDLKYEYKMSVNEQAISPDHLNHISQGPDINSLISSSAVKAQVLDSIKSSFIVDPQPVPSLEQVSSQFHGALTLGTREQSCESRELDIPNMNNHVLEDQVLSAEEASTAASPSPDSSEHSVNFKGTTTSNGANAIMPEKSVSTGQTNILISAKTSETALLDERSLLARIVRTIPTGGRIRISSTLPNRLGKMLSPLHWHDYKKKYGKLDDFVASHPKPNRLKKALRSIDSNHVRENALFKEHAGITKNASNGQQLVMQNQHPNGICVDVSRGFSNVKILSQSKDQSVTSVESMASGHGRSNSNVVGKQQSRIYDELQYSAVDQALWRLQAYMCS